MSNGAQSQSNDARTIRKRRVEAAEERQPVHHWLTVADRQPIYFTANPEGRRILAATLTVRLPWRTLRQMASSQRLAGSSSRGRYRDDVTGSSISLHGFEAWLRDAGPPQNLHQFLKRECRNSLSGARLRGARSYLLKQACRHHDILRPGPSMMVTPPYVELTH